MFKLGVAGGLFAVCIGLWSFTLPKLSPGVNTRSDYVLLAWAVGGLLPFLLGLWVLRLGWKQDEAETRQREEDRALQAEKLRKEIHELDLRAKDRENPAPSDFVIPGGKGGADAPS